MIFDNREIKNAKNLPFNWGVDYLDGTYLTEYEEESGNRNDYYTIQTDNIDRFGLFGSGHKYFYTRDGAFYLDGNRIDIEYHLSDEIKGLTSIFTERDCITYKDAYVKRNINQVEQDVVVNAINFGYKTLYHFEDFQMYFQAIVKAYASGNIEMEIKATSNAPRNGKIVFKNKGIIIDSFDFPLSINQSSNLNWIIK